MGQPAPLHIGGWIKKGSDIYRRSYGNSAIEWTNHAELYVQLEDDAVCVSCEACYDADGVFAGKDKCPEHCEDHGSPKRWSTPFTHSLVSATDGFQAKGKQGGAASVSTANVPSAPLEPARLGGARYTALFVAPHNATYTLKPTFDDSGEMWLSPDASAAHAELAVASHLPGSSGLSAAVTFTAKVGDARYLELLVANDAGESKLRLSITTKLEVRRWKENKR